MAAPGGVGNLAPAPAPAPATPAGNAPNTGNNQVKNGYFVKNWGDGSRYICGGQDSKLFTVFPYFEFVL